MNVPYAVVRKHFVDPDNVGREELYKWIGYPENITNPNFENTCAIRLSLALLGAGFPNPGTYPIKAGKYQGRMIETQVRRLSKFLSRQLGEPEKFKSGPAAEKGVGTRRGIVAFFHLYGADSVQNHIAIVATAEGQYTRCGLEHQERPTGCYWGATEVWFWPLR